MPALRQDFLVVLFRVVLFRVVLFQVVLLRLGLFLQPLTRTPSSVVVLAEVWEVFSEGLAELFEVKDNCLGMTEQRQRSVGELARPHFE